MGVCTDMIMQVEFDSVESQERALANIQKFKETSGRSQMRIDDYPTSLNIEDYYDRKPSAEYIVGELIKVFKDSGGVIELNCDLRQTVDSYYFEGENCLDEA